MTALAIKGQQRSASYGFNSSPFIPNIVVYGQSDEQGNGHRDFWIIAFDEPVHRGSSDRTR